jgi:hypothetical protein
MTRSICPGQDTRYWKPGDIFEATCPASGEKVEFFKDDVSRPCQCGHRVENPRISLGCAQWCPHAVECLDPAAGTDAGGTPAVPLRARLTAAMVEQFGDDERRIRHALRVLAHAEAIRATEGGDALVVTAAALLHDIGIQEAERIYGSPAPRYQEELGPPIARAVMDDLAMDAVTIEHVVRIVGSHHSAKDIDTIEFRIIWDADALVNLADEEKDRPADWWERTIPKVFRTDAGGQRARLMFLGR